MFHFIFSPQVINMSGHGHVWIPLLIPSLQKSQRERHSFCTVYIEYQLCVTHVLYDRDTVETKIQGFPGGSVVKNPPANAGTRVWSLVWEDPTCRGATKPVCHNYWAHVPQLLKLTCLDPVLRNKRSHCNEKPEHRNRVAPAHHN